LSYAPLHVPPNVAQVAAQETGPLSAMISQCSAVSEQVMNPG
jgi:hypothetical protein